MMATIIPEEPVVDDKTGDLFTPPAEEHVVPPSESVFIDMAGDELQQPQKEVEKEKEKENA